MMSSVQDQYQYQHSGVVKAYKRMTPQKALALNRELAARGGCGHWVLMAESASAQPGHVLELPKAA